MGIDVTTSLRGTLRAAGFEVNAVIAGGAARLWQGAAATPLKGMLQGMHVPLEVSPLSDGFKYHLISAAIEDNGEIGYETYSGD